MMGTSRSLAPWLAAVIVFLSFCAAGLRADGPRKVSVLRFWPSNHALIGCQFVQFLPDGVHGVVESRWTGPTSIATAHNWWPSLGFGSPLGTHGIIHQDLSQISPELKVHYSARGCLSGDGAVFASSVTGPGGAPAICIWSVKSKRCISRIVLHRARNFRTGPAHLALSLHGRRIVFRGSDGSLHVVRVKGGTIAFRLPLPNLKNSGGLVGICFAGGDRIVAASVQHLMAWTLPGGRMIYRKAMADRKRSGFSCMIPADAGNILVCSGWSGTKAELPVWVYTAASGRLKRAFRFPNRLARKLSATGGRNPWFNAMGTCLSVAAKGEVAAIAEQVSGDIRQPFPGGFGRYIVFDLKTGDAVAKSGAIMGGLWSASLSPNGRELLGATAGSIRLWAVARRP